MRIAAAALLILLPVALLSCATSQPGPTQDLLATVDARVEATREAAWTMRDTEQTAPAEEAAKGPTQAAGQTSAATKTTSTPELKEPATPGPQATPETSPTSLPNVTIPYTPPTLEPRRGTPTALPVTPGPTPAPSAAPTAGTTATAPAMPTGTPRPEPTAERPVSEPEPPGTYLYQDPKGVFTFSYPDDCGRLTESAGPDGSRLATNEDTCPGIDGEIDVALETSELTEGGETPPLPPESAARELADTLAALTEDAHRETLTTRSRDTLELVRNEVQVWADEKIVLVTVIHVNAGWQATDIIMSYWASGKDDPNWERILEALRTFTTGAQART